MEERLGKVISDLFLRPEAAELRAVLVEINALPRPERVKLFITLAQALVVCAAAAASIDTNVHRRVHGIAGTDGPDDPE